MKLVRVSIKNVKSFKNLTTINFDDQYNILIGPNGGGKSNLLDIITLTIRKFFLLSYEVRETDKELEIQKSSRLDSINYLLEKFIGDNTESCIKITIKIDQQDIDNIRNMKRYSNEFKKVLTEKYNSSDSSYYFDKIIDIINNFNYLLPEIIPLNQELTFSIKNNQLDVQSLDGIERDYLIYLNSLELCLILSKDVGDIRFGDIKLSPIYLYFSPYRSDNNFNTEVNLSSKNYYELLSGYLEASSKKTASIIKLASLYFAEKKRSYEYKISIGEGDQTLWNNDVEVKKVTEILKKLGLCWDLRLKDINKNIYEIILTKQNKEFHLSQASSGEKEMINFILGLFAFNIKGGLLIIDEPELHLHPKWQTLFLDVLMDLAEITNNQFILSTHSISFINKNTVSNIIRIYKDNNSSKVATLDKLKLIAAKDLLHIINSYNNEKVFFADKVVLVEGKSDKLIFQRLINYYSSIYEQTKVVEVVEVDGKSNLQKYRKFLESFSIENYIIADLDYAQNVGDEKIKKLFIVDLKKIKDEVIAKPDKSLDGQALLKVLEKALASENLEEYREEISNLFEYIKARNRKIKDNLTFEEENMLKNFIDSKINEKTYILRKGQIENYLPNGFKTLDKIVNLVEDEVFHTVFMNQESEEVFNERRKELNEIVFKILAINQSENCPAIQQTQRGGKQVSKGNKSTILSKIKLKIFSLLWRTLVFLTRSFRSYREVFTISFIVGTLLLLFSILLRLLLLIFQL